MASGTFTASGGATQDKAITPHVAQNTNGRRSAVDDRITRRTVDGARKNPIESPSQHIIFFLEPPHLLLVLIGA
jgi:hypothetical protein